MKQLIFVPLAFVSLTISAQVKPAAKPSAAKPAAIVLKNGSDSFSYAIGLSVGETLKNMGAKNVNTQLIAQACNQIITSGKTLMTPEQASMTIQEKLQAYQQAKKTEQKLVEDKWFAENAKKPGVIALPNGLQYEVILAGDPNGPRPKVIDTVVVHYKGNLINGFEFDNSFKRGEPATFRLQGVITGWTEILQMMPKGAHWKVYIPTALGYGDNPPPGSGIPNGSTLIFEIMLQDIKPATPAIAQ